jgi:magnesium-transporting ATPase (P-type)
VTGEYVEDIPALKQAHIGFADEKSSDIVKAECTVLLKDFTTKAF